MKTQSVAVFCGSREGKNKIFATHAQELGKLIAVLGIKLVYGGVNKGLMGCKWLVPALPVRMYLMYTYASGSRNRPFSPHSPLIANTSKDLPKFHGLWLGWLGNIGIVRLHG